jgi:hypothetical protein
MFSARAFVAIYDADAAHGAYRAYDYPKEGSGTLTFYAPSSKGNYEMRLYNKDGEYTDATFVMKVAFRVNEDSEDGGESPAGYGGGGSGGGDIGAYEWWYPEWTPEKGIDGWKEGDPYPEWWYPGWVPPGWYD